MVKYLLIVTIASQSHFTHIGLGGVTLETFDTKAQCQEALYLTREQLKNHKVIDMDDVKMSCKPIGE